MRWNRTFAFQLVGVAVVVGIIFFAFLRPTNPGELFGIDAPDGEQPSFAGPTGGRSEHQKGVEEKFTRAAGDDGRHQSRARGYDGVPGSQPDPGAQPSDDQYTDLATALMARVGRSSPP